MPLDDAADGNVSPLRRDDAFPIATDRPRAVALRLQSPGNLGRREEAGEALSKIMRRRALSAPAVSRMTGGEVSASAVRAYQAGGRPRPGKMAALASALGPEDGRELLRLFAFEEMLHGFTRERGDVASGDEGPPAQRLVIEHQGEPLTVSQRQAVAAFIKLLQAEASVPSH